MLSTVFLFFYFIHLHPIQAFDDGTRRSLGTLSLPLNILMREPNLEYYQQTFMLTMGVHQSPMVVTVRLRVSLLYSMVIWLLGFQ